MGIMLRFQHNRPIFANSFAGGRSNPGVSGLVLDPAMNQCHRFVAPLRLNIPHFKAGRLISLGETLGKFWKNPGNVDWVQFF